MKRKLPRTGSYRYRYTFLIFPRIINDELRWWERARWEQERVCDWVGFRGWKNIQWK